MFKNSNSGDYFSPLNSIIIIFSIIDIILYKYLDKLIHIEYTILIIILIMTNAIILGYWKYEQKFKHSIKEKHITLEKIYNIEKPFAISNIKIKKDNLATDEDITEAYWFDLVLINRIFAITNIILLVFSMFDLWPIKFSFGYAFLNIIASALLIIMGDYIRNNIIITLFNTINDNNEINVKCYYFKDMIVLENNDNKNIKVIPCFDIKKEYKANGISYHILFENYKKYYFVLDEDNFELGNKDIVKKKYHKIIKK